MKRQKVRHELDGSRSEPPNNIHSNGSIRKEGGEVLDPCQHQQKKTERGTLLGRCTFRRRQSHRPQERWLAVGFDSGRRIHQNRLSRSRPSNHYFALGVFLVRSCLVGLGRAIARCFVFVTSLDSAY